MCFGSAGANCPIRKKQTHLIKRKGMTYLLFIALDLARNQTFPEMVGNFGKSECKFFCFCLFCSDFLNPGLVVVSLLVSLLNRNQLNRF